MEILGEESAKKEEASLGRFLAAHGGPFYGLQQQLGLLREDAFRAGPRALLFVGLAWGVPLALSLIAGDALGTHAAKPYLCPPSTNRYRSSSGEPLSPIAPWQHGINVAPNANSWAEISVSRKMLTRMQAMRSRILPKCLQRPKNSLHFLSKGRRCYRYLLLRPYRWLPPVLHNYQSRRFLR